jgi:cytochrome c peroxidase
MLYCLTRIAALGACVSFLSCAGGTGPQPAAAPDPRSPALRALRYDEAEPPLDVSNRYELDAAARTFGHRLFFDPRLSGPLTDGDNDGSEVTLGVKGEAGRISCAGCHVPESGFFDTRSRGQQASLGARWTKRRAPQLAEIAFAGLYNWDGGRDSLWRQAVGVMDSEIEFNAGRLLVAKQTFDLHRAEYEAIFGPMPPLDDSSRFPWIPAEESGCQVLPGLVLDCHGRPGDEAEFDAMTQEDQDLVTGVTVNVAKALAAFLRGLRCGPGRFDAWLDGDDTALNKAEIRGAELFVGRGQCSTCHSGPLFTDQAFHNVGLKPAQVSIVVRDSNDRGAGEALPLALDDPVNTRSKFSDGDPGRLRDGVGPELEGAFRTPTLRCAASQPSFMHTAQLRTLADVVDFFNQGGHASGYPGTNELKPLNLTDQDKADLVAFMQTLLGSGPSATDRAPPPPYSATPQ